MATKAGGAYLASIKMPLECVRAVPVRAEGFEKAYYKVRAVLAPGTNLDGVDMGGYTFTCDSNAFVAEKHGRGRTATFSIPASRLIRLEGPGRDVVEVDAWKLTSAVKRQREEATAAPLRDASGAGAPVPQAHRPVNPDKVRAVDAVLGRMRDKASADEEEKARSRASAALAGAQRAASATSVPARPPEPSNPRASALKNFKINEERRLNKSAERAGAHAKPPMTESQKRDAANIENAIANPKTWKSAPARPARDAAAAERDRAQAQQRRAAPADDVARGTRFNGKKSGEAPAPKPPRRAPRSETSDEMIAGALAAQRWAKRRA